MTYEEIVITFTMLYVGTREESHLLGVKLLRAYKFLVDDF